LNNDVVCCHTTPLGNIFFFLFGHVEGGTIGDSHQRTPYQVNENGADDDGENRRTHVPQDCELGQLSTTFLHGHQILYSKDHGDNDQW
jgi:hypothetical protein